jgi:hypothetical protein
VSLHLQVTSLGSVAGPAPSAAASGPAPEGGASASFAALLDALTPAAATAGSTANAPAAGEAASDPKAVLKDFLDALQALQTALGNGQPIDPALKDRLEHDADTLLEGLKTPGDDTKTAVDAVGSVAGLAAAIFAPGLAPLVSAAANVAGNVAENAGKVAPPAVWPTSPTGSPRLPSS